MQSSGQCVATAGQSLAIRPSGTTRHAPVFGSGWQQEAKREREFHQPHKEPEGRGRLISHHNVLNRITVDTPCGGTRMRFLVHYVGGAYTFCNCVSGDITRKQGDF